MHTLPWSQLPTYIFVAVFVLVVVFVAVPTREEILSIGKRDYMEGVHVAANGSQTGPAGEAMSPLRLGTG